MARNGYLPWIIAGSATAVLLLLASDTSDPCGCGDIDMTEIYASQRAAIARVACAEASAWGDLPRVADYWQASGLTAPYPPAWCGAFALWALRAAGVTAPDWRIGIGFVAPAGLHITTSPRQGDIMYRDQPWQHYGVVVCPGNRAIETVEGNTPGINARHHPRGDRRYVYYSIEPLLKSTFGKSV